jgi:hypothetical protein
MTNPESFEHAFVVTSYFLGVRVELTGGLARPTAAATRMAARLGEGDRDERARRLAAELRPVVEALAMRSVRAFHLRRSRGRTRVARG